MSNTIYITDRNPTAFFEALAEKINEGFYADDSVEGAPHFDMINEVKLTRTDKPSQRNDLKEMHTVNISAFSNTTFVLDIQDAILQGFEIVPESIFISEPHAPHSIALVRPAVVEDKKEETKPESTQAPRRGGRPAKSKEA